MEVQLKILPLFIFLFLNSAATQTIGPVQRLSSQTEWRALLDLRSSLAITAKDWHKRTNPCSNWTGIECRDGHVTRINLSGLRRTRAGKLNPRFAIDSLQYFPLLSTFNSSGFSLKGSIPEWLGQKLRNLEILDLSSCSIYGSIPSSLGSLNKLHVLHLSNNSITGNMPTTLGKLFSLSVLNLSINLLTGQIPNEISSLVNLTSLDLAFNFLSGGIPLDFGSLSKLKLLNLSSNSLSSFIPPQLGKLSQLTELDLGYNSLFGPLPDELGGLISLKKLLIGNNELQGSLLEKLFKKLTKLEYLVLCGNDFGGTLPNIIWNIPDLKYLDVSNNNLTGSFSFLSSYNVNVGVFNFSSNLFYGNLSSGIGKIHILDVSSNYFEGLIPNEMNNTIILTNNCFSSGLPSQRNLEDCQKFYWERNISFGNDTGYKAHPPLVRHTNSRRKLTYVMVGVFGGLGFIVVVIPGFLLLVKACKTGRRDNQIEDPNVGVIEPPPPPKVFLNLSGLGQPFTHEEMVLATCNFSTENFIKHGRSGDIFRGILEGGSHVVIKRVDLRLVKNESFMSELEFFAKVSNHKLVPLVGHCLEDENEKFLVYKCMKNGDLSNALYRLTSGEDSDLQSLDWITRLKIAIGAAEALAYLHHECTPPVVHRNIQASSILLDDKYEVRLGSFSEVYTLEANHHNMIARLLRTAQASGKRPSGSSSITCAYDVFCFGKVLLELVTGKLGISSRLNEVEAKQWLETILPFITMHEKEQVIKIVDQSLIIDEDLLEEVWAVAIVAKSCLNPKASRRPSMRHVLKALENPFKVVREENFSSGLLRTSSSRQSWTLALFGSWHHSSSESSNVSAQTNREIIGGMRQAERVGSRGSGANDHSSSHKRSSSDVFPEPVEMQDGTS